MFVWHFVDPDLGVEKEGTTEKDDIDFGMERSDTCYLLVLAGQENFKQRLSRFSFFFRTKFNSF